MEANLSRQIRESMVMVVHFFPGFQATCLEVHGSWSINLVATHQVPTRTHRMIHLQPMPKRIVQEDGGDEGIQKDVGNQGGM